MKLDVASRGRVSKELLSRPYEEILESEKGFFEEPVPGSYWERLAEMFDLLPKTKDADFDIEPFV